MHWIDLLIVGLLTWTTIAAFRNGLIREVVKLVSLVVGVVLAGMFYDDLSDNIAFLVEDQTTRNLLSFAALLSGSLILGQIAAGMLRGTARALMLGPFDHAGGAAFGLIKGLVLVEVVLVAVSVFPPSSAVATTVEESALAPVLLEQLAVVELWLPAEFDDALEHLRRWQASLPSSLDAIRPPR